MLRVWKKTKQRTNEVSVLQIRAVITALTQSVNTDATLRFAHTLQSVTHGVVARVFGRVADSCRHALYCVFKRHSTEGALIEPTRVVYYYYTLHISTCTRYTYTHPHPHHAQSAEAAQSAQSAQS